MKEDLPRTTGATFSLASFAKVRRLSKHHGYSPMIPASGTRTVPTMFLDTLSQSLRYRMVVSTESKRLAELLAGFTLFLDRCRSAIGFSSKVTPVPFTTKCKVRHTIGAQVHIEQQRSHPFPYAGRLFSQRSADLSI